MELLYLLITRAGETSPPVHAIYYGGAGSGCSRALSGQTKYPLGFCGIFPGRIKCAGYFMEKGSAFQLAGIFSGSLWWRTLDKDDPDYQDEQHRIMHNQIRDGEWCQA